MVGASSRGCRFDSLWEPAVIEKMLQEYNVLWKADREASANSPDILMTITSVLGRLPTTWNDIPIDRDKVRLATFFSLYETESAASVFDAFVAAEKGDPGGLALLVLGYDEAVQDTSRQYWGDFITKLVSSGMDSTRDYENHMDPPGSVLGSPSAKLWWTAASHGGWPVGQIPRSIRNSIRSASGHRSSTDNWISPAAPHYGGGHAVFQKRRDARDAGNGPHGCVPASAGGDRPPCGAVLHGGSCRHFEVPAAHDRFHAWRLCRMKPSGCSGG